MTYTNNLYYKPFMENLTCGVCRNDFDLKKHRPIKLMCKKHTICLECFANMYDEKKFIHCPFDTEFSNEDSDAYSLNLDIVRYLQHIQVDCYYDNNLAVCFDDKKAEAVCSSHGFPRIDASVLEIKIHTRFVGEFLKHKKFLSAELRNVFLLVLKMGAQEKQSFMYALKMYTQPLSVYFDPDLYPLDNFVTEYVFDQVRFRLCGKDCADYEFELNYDNLGTLLSSMFQMAVDEKVWFYTNALKSYFAIKDSYNRLFVELAYMLKKFLNNIAQISCQGCNKPFQVGNRMPFKLTCEHTICYSCSKIFNYCTICSKVLQIDNPYLDQTLYELPKCCICKLPIDNLTYHCICANFYCNKCAVQQMAYSCQDCMKLNDLNYFIKLKVSKKVLNLMRYNKIDINCYHCKSQKAAFYSKQFNITMCNQCDRTVKDANCVRLVPGYNLDMLLIGIFENSLKSYYPQIIFEPLRMNKKLKIISDIYSNQYNNLHIPNPDFLQIKELKLCSKIYPVNKQDRRFFTSKKVRSIQLNFNQNVYLCGVIAAGPINDQIIEATVSVSHSKREIQITEKVLGKYGYFFINELCYNYNFHIQINYRRVEQLFTGVSFDTSFMQSNIVLTKFSQKDTHSVSGPILGILYALE